MKSSRHPEQTPDPQKKAFQRKHLLQTRFQSPTSEYQLILDNQALPWKNFYMIIICSNKKSNIGPFSFGKG